MQDWMNDRKHGNNLSNLLKHGNSKLLTLIGDCAIQYPIKFTVGNLSEKQQTSCVLFLTTVFLCGLFLWLSTLGCVNTSHTLCVVIPPNYTDTQCGDTIFPRVIII